MTDDEDTENFIVNDYDEFISEIDLETQLPKRLDPLSLVKAYNRETLECLSFNNIKNINSDEGKLAKILSDLKLNMHVPLYPQLYDY